MSKNIENALIDLEQKRAAALTAKDWATLTAITAEDFTHTHSSGRTDDRTAYLAGLQKRPRGIERKDLKVRLYGDLAVMSGVQLNIPEGAEPEADPVNLALIQVWVKKQAGWQVVASQATRIK